MVVLDSIKDKSYIYFKSKIMKNYFLLLIAFCFSVSSCVQMRGIGDDYKYLTSYEKTLIEPFKKENWIY